MILKVHKLNELWTISEQLAAGSPWQPIASYESQSRAISECEAILKEFRREDSPSETKFFVDKIDPI